MILMSPLWPSPSLLRRRLPPQSASGNGQARGGPDFFSAVPARGASVQCVHRAAAGSGRTHGLNTGARRVPRAPRPRVTRRKPRTTRTGEHRRSTHGRRDATRDAGRNTRRHPDNAPLPFLPRRKHPTPRATTTCLPVPAHCPARTIHPRLFSSSPQLPRPLPVLLRALFFPVCSTSLGLSYLGLAVRSPSTEASAAEGSGLGARRTTGEILFDLHKLLLDN